MTNIVLVIIGSILTMLWGISHLFATKGVVRDFGEISQDNKNIITMEWIVEGISLIFIGFLVMLVTILGGTDNMVTMIVNVISSVMLFGLAVVSLFTGFKVKFFVFKLCPVIFTVSGILILVGNFL